ncbi:hypothetical protein DEU56DRAFT_753293 [Suillus clintonianus]|uniref:uncharacterized protein n=1 Tax=Suillus clintonianus TaxID=1904413 RepID=UPI001B87DB2A|nr:uncharacterized protein DEU56DRAFT_753293 [Suillus clintonianus]KAG2148040.1 hypothetical protein DEU56DRAFT_753293 [Suillus clintonianus]
MAASSNPTEENWHPSSLLAYDALPDHQDFDSIISDAKFTADTGTDFYGRSLTSRRYALVGVACSSIFGCLCVVAGLVTLANHGVSGVTPTKMGTDNWLLRVQWEIVTLLLTLIVTFCTESIGFVHDISLRSALASESRLRFNTNLRLLTAARGWYNPNGALLNGVSAVLLIISYSSAGLVVCVDYSAPTPSPDWVLETGLAFAGLPLLLLGVALLLQVVIALSGMRAAKILTWSSSPFDLTAALVHHTQLTPVSFRCMRSCAGWAGVVLYIQDNDADMGVTNPAQPWSFLPTPDERPGTIVYNISGSNLQGWILIFFNVGVFQGPLTLGLHCSELIANVIRDERQWRCATGRKGIRMATNPLKSIFTHPICLLLFVVKPFLHWMFGLGFNIDVTASGEQLPSLQASMSIAQIWNLCIALVIFACLFTLVALRRPRGPQPATYGHLQTLANLVDEWSTVMWWGHKEDGIPYCHAGTSDHPLQDVKMDCVYAGSGVEPPASGS